MSLINELINKLKKDYRKELPKQVFSEQEFLSTTIISKLLNDNIQAILVEFHNTYNFESYWFPVDKNKTNEIMKLDKIMSKIINKNYFVHVISNNIHWVSILIDFKNHNIEFYDSLGQDPENYNSSEIKFRWEYYINKYNTYKKLKVFDHSIQKGDYSCGGWNLFLILSRVSEFLTLESIQQIESLKISEEDICWFIAQFSKRYTPTIQKIPVLDPPLPTFQYILYDKVHKINDRECEIYLQNDSKNKNIVNCAEIFDYMFNLNSNISPLDDTIINALKSNINFMHRISVDPLLSVNNKFYHHTRLGDTIFKKILKSGKIDDDFQKSEKILSIDEMYPDNKPITFQNDSRDASDSNYKYLQFLSIYFPDVTDRDKTYKYIEKVSNNTYNTQIFILNYFFFKDIISILIENIPNIPFNNNLWKDKGNNYYFRSVFQTYQFLKYVLNDGWDTAIKFVYGIINIDQIIKNININKIKIIYEDNVWNKIRLLIMTYLFKQKFSDVTLLNALKSTSPHELIYNNIDGLWKEKIPLLLLQIRESDKIDFPIKTISKSKESFEIKHKFYNYPYGCFDDYVVADYIASGYYANIYHACKGSEDCEQCKINKKCKYIIKIIPVIVQRHYEDKISNIEKQIDNEIEISIWAGKNNLGPIIYKTGSCVLQEGLNDKIEVKYIIMEKLDSELSFYIEKYKKKINFESLFQKLKDIASKLDENKYIHGDIKPSNIMLNYDSNDINNITKLVFIDFGQSIKIEKKHEKNKKDIEELIEELIKKIRKQIVEQIRKPEPGQIEIRKPQPEQIGTPEIRKFIINLKNELKDDIKNWVYIAIEKRNDIINQLENIIDKEVDLIIKFKYLGMMFSFKYNKITQDIFDMLTKEEQKNVDERYIEILKNYLAE